MNWRFLKFDSIPPKIHLNSDERSELKLLIAKATSPRHKAWRIRLIYWLCFIIAWTALIWWLRDIVGIDSKYGFLFLIIGLLGFYIAALCALMPGRKQLTIRCLDQMGYKICESCSHVMSEHGDDITVCPECGWGREV